MGCRMGHLDIGNPAILYSIIIIVAVTSHANCFHLNQGPSYLYRKYNSRIEKLTIPYIMRKLTPHHFTLHPPDTLPTPQVSTNSSSLPGDPQIRLVLTRPEGYNSGRFILRYDCEFRGTPIELEYRSTEISGSSDVVVRRSRSCFVVGEISRVTVWFVSGGHISCTPAVVNATSGEGERRKYSIKLWQNINIHQPSRREKFTIPD